MTEGRAKKLEQMLTKFNTFCNLYKFNGGILATRTFIPFHNKAILIISNAHAKRFEIDTKQMLDKHGPVFKLLSFTLLEHTRIDVYECAIIILRFRNSKRGWDAITDLIKTYSCNIIPQVTNKRGIRTYKEYEYASKYIKNILVRNNIANHCTLYSLLKVIKKNQNHFYTMYQNILKEDY